MLLLSSCALAGDFADRVVSYAPAPGVSAGVPDFADPTAALGAPAGAGPVDGSATGVVTLSGFGGEIVLAFDHTVLDDPRNPHGLDAIVFGNAFWSCVSGCAGTDPARRWSEAGVIELSLDVNDNGLADDPWFVVRGSSLPDPPASALATRDWGGGIVTSGYELPAAFSPPPPFFLVNPADSTATGDEAFWGYADLSPVLPLGDLSGAVGAPGEGRTDDPEDDPSMSPGAYYTFPDDPRTLGIDPRAPGGDAFDIAWAVDPQTGAPANLPGFDFMRIRTGVDAPLGPLGELSTDLDAVADVRAVGDLDGDDAIGPADLAALIGAWGTPGGRADLDGDGVVAASDLALLVGGWGGAP